MTYSDLYLQRKVNRSAYLVSVMVIVLSFFTWFSFSLMEGKETRASQETARRVEVVNLGDQGTGIFWQTKSKQVSWLIYGKNENKLDKVRYDSRDISSNQKRRINHYVELDQLEADSRYFFRLVTKKKVINRLGNKPFSFHTLSSRTANISEKPAYGKVVDQTGNLSVGNVVILKTVRSLPLFTFTRSTGEWLIPLSTLVDKKTKNYLSLSPHEIIKIEIIGKTGITSHITADKMNLSPLSEVTILGKDYRLVGTNEKVLAATDIVGNDEKSNRNSEKNKIAIIYPVENSIIPDSSPLIKGTALPLKKVAITIKAKSIYSAKVKADKMGIWFLATPITLSPGEHEILIKTLDERGKLIMKERKFTIAKSGEQVLGEATKSADISSPTPTRELLISPMPTVFSPSPTVAKPTPKIPVTGFNIGKLSIVSTSLITVGLGLFLVF